MDKRRRQYVPVAVTLAHGRTGTRLKERFGRDGILVWTLYLAACKRNWVQGQFTYTSEADGWGQLGLFGYEPAFTLDEFFAFTGQLKKTRRRRSGDVTDVLCTRWEQWNNAFRTQLGREEKSRKRAENTADIPATEVEVEVEYEEEVEASAGEPAIGGSRGRCPECDLGGNQHVADCSRRLRVIA